METTLPISKSQGRHMSWRPDILSIVSLIWISAILPIIKLLYFRFGAKQTNIETTDLGAFETVGILAELGRRTNPLRGRFVRDGLGAWIWVDCDFD
jgi:hypothetical protein